MANVVTRLPVTSVRATIKIENGLIVDFSAFNKDTTASWEFDASSTLNGTVDTVGGRSLVRVENVVPVFTANGLHIKSSRAAGIREQYSTAFYPNDFNKFTFVMAIYLDIAGQTVTSGDFVLSGSYYSGAGRLMLNYHQDSATSGYFAVQDDTLSRVTIPIVPKSGWVFFAFSYDSIAGKISATLRQVAANAAWTTSDQNQQAPMTVSKTLPLSIGGWETQAGSTGLGNAYVKKLQVLSKYMNRDQLEGLYQSFKSEIPGM